MSSATYTSVATVDRIPGPSTHKFNTCYIAQAEERTEITEQEESYVEELCDLIQHYRHEYARLTNEIRRSRTRFNAVAYISRLPEELLATIFEMYVADHWERYYPLENPACYSTAYRVTPYQWIKNVLHVCGQWRRIALSTPQLWTYIAYDKLYEDWRLNFLLEHAGNLPLTLRRDRDLYEDPYRPKEDIDPEDLYEYRPSGPEFFEQVMQGFFARIGTLSLTTSEQVDFLDLFVDIDKGGDRDENSDRDGDSDGIKDSSEDQGRDVSGNNDERALVTPLMRHLLLDLSLDNWCSPLFRNLSMPYLRSLILNEAPLELAQRLSCSSLTRLDVVFSHDVLPHEILDLLMSIPALHQLDVTPIVSDMAADSGCGAALQPTVTLPSLESLYIGGTAFGVTRLLNQLIFPVNTAIRLGTGPFPPSLLSSIMPTVLGHTAGSGTLSATDHMQYVSPHDITIRTTRDHYTYMDVYFWRTSASTLWVAPNSPQALIPDSSWVQDDDARLHISCSTEIGTLEGKLAILDTSKLLSLSLSSVWFPLVGKPHHGLLERLVLPQLETLHLNDSSVVGYPKVQGFLQGLIGLGETAPPMPAEVDRDDSQLMIHSVNSTQDPSTRLLLPSLKTLRLPEIIFYTRELGPPDSTDGDGVFALLRRCAQRGYKLQRLEFKAIILAELDSDETDKMTRSAFQDAVSKTGFADVVEVRAYD